MESQATLVQQKKVKENEKLGCHWCQTLVGEDQSQQHFFHTSRGTCSGHMKRWNEDSSRMLNASPVFRVPEFMDCPARSQYERATGGGLARHLLGSRAPRVLERRDKFTAKVKPEKAPLPTLLHTC